MPTVERLMRSTFDPVTSHIRARRTPQRASSNHAKSRASRVGIRILRIARGRCGVTYAKHVPPSDLPLCRLTVRLLRRASLPGRAPHSVAAREGPTEGFDDDGRAVERPHRSGVDDQIVPERVIDPRAEKASDERFAVSIFALDFPARLLKAIGNSTVAR